MPIEITNGMTTNRGQLHLINEGWEAFVIEYVCMALL